MILLKTDNQQSCEGRWWGLITLWV